MDSNIAIVDYSTEEVRDAMAGMYLHQLLGKTIEQAGVTDFAIRLAKENPETLVRMFNRLLESVGCAGLLGRGCNQCHCSSTDRHD